MNDLILTEKRNPNTIDIDLSSSEKIIELINNEDIKVAYAVQKELKSIAQAVDLISQKFLSGGNLLYFGAGTSGRLGVLDASECPPTFGVDGSMVRGYIAGGDFALKNAIEGAEDDFEAGVNDFNNSNPVENDVVVGISASGNPDYLLGVLKTAKEKGLSTVGIVCNREAKMKTYSDVFIAVEVGEEAITGSTRMKSGTAQKMVLNMLTTGAMVKIGKTYQNYMIDVKPTNEKLKHRATRIVSELVNVDILTAQKTLELCDYKVKTAVVMLRLNLNKQEAINLLNRYGGKLREVLN